MTLPLHIRCQALFLIVYEQQVFRMVARFTITSHQVGCNCELATILKASYRGVITVKPSG